MHNFSVVRTKRNCKQQNCASACAVVNISANEKHAEHSNERKLKFIPKEILQNRIAKTYRIGL